MCRPSSRPSATASAILPPFSDKIAMGKRYRCVSAAERTTIEELTLRGLSNGVMVRQVGVKKSTVAHIAKRVRRNGHTARPTRSGRPPLVDDRGSRRLLRIVRSGRYATLAELRAACNTGCHKPNCELPRSLGVTSRCHCQHFVVACMGLTLRPVGRRQSLMWGQSTGASS